MIDDFARVVRAHLREQIENRKEDLARGQPSDFSEYKRLVGQIQGLQFADEYIADLAQRAEIDDEDA